MQAILLTFVLMFPPDEVNPLPRLDFLQDTTVYQTMAGCEEAGKVKMAKAQPEVKGWLCLGDESNEQGSDDKPLNRGDIQL